MPYFPGRLDEQLDDAARAVVSDPRRNEIDAAQRAQVGRRVLVTWRLVPAANRLQRRGICLVTDPGCQGKSLHIVWLFREGSLPIRITPVLGM